MLLEKVKTTIKKHRMIVPGDKVLVAVSGGPDSVCLLSVLHALAKDLNLSLHVAHLDHMFRGEESAAEARFVRELADKLGIPATTEQIDLPAYCRERGLSPQAGAREVRYDFLNRVSERVGAQRIALGHTATDQAETFLMRMMRGAGASGLSAIPPKRENIIRPLIEVTREEVLEHLGRNGLNFVTDSSNIKPIYTRNRIRLELMPALEKFNPRIVETLADEADLLRDEGEAMEGYLSTIVPRILVEEKDNVKIKRDKYNAQPTAIRRRILRKAIDKAGIRSAGLSWLHIEEALGFMSTAQTGRAMHLPGNLIIERQYDHFLVHKERKAVEFFTPLSVPGITTVAEAGLEVETQIVDVLNLPFEFPLSYKTLTPTPLPLRERDKGRGPHDRGDKEKGLLEDKNYLWQAVFDYDKIALPLYLRTKRQGDRFCPAGMGGKSKKLQDFFTDRKVPRLERNSVPILASDKDVLWVVGMRTDERFLPGAETKKALAVRVKARTGEIRDA